MWARYMPRDTHRRSIIIRSYSWLLRWRNASYNETRRPLEKHANNNACNQTLEFEWCCFYCRHTGREELVQNCPRSTLTTQRWPSMNRSTCERYFTLDLRTNWSLSDINFRNCRQKRPWQPLISSKYFSFLLHDIWEKSFKNMICINTEWLFFSSSILYVYVCIYWSRIIFRDRSIIRERSWDFLKSWHQEWKIALWIKRKE